MSDPSPKPQRNAWQPLSFGGVAAFAHASLSRLFVVELLVALLVAASVVWFATKNYSPVILGAIQKMPELARIENGSLTNLPSQVLSENKLLSLAVDLEENGKFGQSAEVQIELHSDNLRVCSLLRSLFGCLAFDYPTDSSLSLNRSQLEPWWGAWEPMILLGIGIAVVVVLFLFWSLLAIIYMPAVKLIGYFADRNLSWRASWRLASAALLPGAIFMAFVVTLYGLGSFDLIALGFFWAGHLVIGWVYVLFSPCFAPRLESVALPRTNPFSP